MCIIMVIKLVKFQVLLSDLVLMSFPQPSVNLKSMDSFNLLMEVTFFKDE